ncbi:hypothetical protein ACJZ2D_011916 [Fusarium nematophilum]
MPDPEIFVFRWARGGEPTSGLEAVANVGAETQWDLRVIVCLDVSQSDDNAGCGAGSTGSDDEQFRAPFSRVIGNEEIWNDFQTERQSSATHAFGWQRLEDGSEEELRQLSGEGDERRREEDHRVWLKPWVFLRWSLGNDDDTETGRARFTRISMLCFRSTVELVKRVSILHRSPTWEHVLEDPFHLLKIIFESWFCRVDDVSWFITKAARRIEQDVFKYVCRGGRTAPIHVNPPHFLRPHIIAKDTIYMLEVVDAAILCLEGVSNRHHTFREKHGSSLNTDEWENTEQSIAYRKQLFHSTKLRISSTNERMKTAINLVSTLIPVFYKFSETCAALQHRNALRQQYDAAGQQYDESPVVYGPSVPPPLSHLLCI